MSSIRYESSFFFKKKPRCKQVMHFWALIEYCAGMINDTNLSMIFTIRGRTYGWFCCFWATRDSDRGILFNGKRTCEFCSTQIIISDLVEKQNCSFKTILQDTDFSYIERKRICFTGSAYRILDGATNCVNCIAFCVIRT